MNFGSLRRRIPFICGPGRPSRGAEPGKTKRNRRTQRTTKTNAKDHNGHQTRARNKEKSEPHHTQNDRPRARTNDMGNRRPHERGADESTGDVKDQPATSGNPQAGARGAQVLIDWHPAVLLLNRPRLFYSRLTKRPEARDARPTRHRRGI